MARKGSSNIFLLIALLIISFISMLVIREVYPVFIDDIGDFFTMFSFIALVILIAFGRKVST